MRVWLSATVYFAVMCCVAAAADPPVNVQPVAAGPLVVSACQTNGNQRNTVVGNRSAYTLRAFSETWTALDASGKSLAAVVVDYGITPPLASGSAAGYSAQVPTAAFTSGAASTISGYNCVLTSATFGNGVTWSPGRPWRGKLVAIAAPKASAAPNSSQLSFQVINAWNDINDGYFVHDTLLIHGGSRDVTIKPRDFLLRAVLSNGGVEEYLGLASAAPSYSKVDPVSGNTFSQPEVDPASDLGALGSLTVPAHGDVTVTVTFALQAPLQNPKADRDVLMR